MSSKSQFSIEFAVLVAFMFLVFVAFIGVITSKVVESKENERLKIAEDIATLAKNEIELAKSASNGYSRNFNLPAKIKGDSYSIEVIDNRELVVKYIDKEYVSFLQEKICGDIFITNNEIDKENGVVCINSNLGQVQCQNAADLSLCNNLDDEFLPGTKCCCCSRYNSCCVVQ